VEAGLQETSYKFPSVTSLVLHGSFFGRNGNMAVCFPALKVLTLMGAAQTILPLLPLLPESLEHLTLDTLAGVPGAPHGTVHLWRLIPALRQGFRIGAAGPREGHARNYARRWGRRADGVAGGSQACERTGYSTESESGRQIGASLCMKLEGDAEIHEQSKFHFVSGILHRYR
jgi:hypothetical protein